MMKYLYSVTLMSVTQSVTALLIVLGVLGHPAVAADIGIVQGATLATFYAFSANSRNLILSGSGLGRLSDILTIRFALLVPLAAFAFLLSVHGAGVSSQIAFFLVVRRCGEWISELHVSAMEVQQDKKAAINFLVVQALGFVVAVGVFLAGDGATRFVGIYAWALLPFAQSAAFVVRQQFSRLEGFRKALPAMFPHFGSTLIIGTTIYAFRLALLVVAGKETAGELLTAFALGGFAGSLFANVFGPSIALNEERYGRKALPREITYVMYFLIAVGSLLLIAAILDLPALRDLGKPRLFWSATGLSLFGGVVMISAQRIRFRLIRAGEDMGLFGADVLANIVLVGSVPFAYYLGGDTALTTLYLVNSAFLYVFYHMAGRNMTADVGGARAATARSMLILGLTIFFPLFFQLSGAIFRAPQTVFDSGGSLASLPLPISVVATFGGIAWLASYRNARLSFGLLITFFMLMFGVSMMTTGEQLMEERRKLLLILQYLLPMLALPLGNAYASQEADQDRPAEKAALWTVAALVPLQLVSSLAQGLYELSPYIYAFSVYQHFQYVPVIVVTAFLLAVFSLWHLPRYRVMIYVLAPLVGAYVYASFSLLAIFEILAGTASFAVLRIFRGHDKRALAPVLAVLVGMAAFHALSPDGKNPKHHIHYAYDKKLGFLQEGSGKVDPVPTNLSRRLNDWKLYSQGIVADVKAFAFGHPRPLGREVSTSAHNYYLDLAYNFGVLSLVPILILIGYTLFRLVRCRRSLWQSEDLFALAAVVLFLVLVDSNLKVTLRQPYPGIVTFFLWGLLLTRLSRLPEIRTDAGANRQAR